MLYDLCDDITNDYDIPYEINEICNKNNAHLKTDGGSGVNIVIEKSSISLIEFYANCSWIAINKFAKDAELLPILLNIASYIAEYYSYSHIIGITDDKEIIECLLSNNFKILKELENNYIILSKEINLNEDSGDYLV